MGVPFIAPAALARIVPGHFAGPATLAGPLPVYREGSTNHCPGCGRAHWHVGRITAECAFCETALPIDATFAQVDAALERPRLVRAPAADRFAEIRLAARSTPVATSRECAS